MTSGCQHSLRQRATQGRHNYEGKTIVRKGRTNTGVGITCLTSIPPYISMLCHVNVYIQRSNDFQGIPLCSIAGFKLVCIQATVAGNVYTVY